MAIIYSYRQKQRNLQRIGLVTASGEGLPDGGDAQADLPDIIKLNRNEFSKHRCPPPTCAILESLNIVCYRESRQAFHLTMEINNLRDHWKERFSRAYYLREIYL